MQQHPPSLRGRQLPRELQQERGLPHPGVPAKHHHAPGHEAAAEHTGEFRAGQRHSSLLFGCADTGMRRGRPRAWGGPAVKSIRAGGGVFMIMNSGAFSIVRLLITN